MRSKMVYACISMDAKKFEGKTPRAESAHNIVLQNEYVDPGYTREVPKVATVTPTGHLVLLRLQAISRGWPAFTVRWDEKQNTIDVDLVGCADDAELFRLGRKGYQGHHPVTVSVDPRVFKIDIRLPQLKVYEALLTCNVGLGLAIKDRM
jgi:hypothetical protein